MCVCTSEIMKVSFAQGTVQRPKLCLNKLPRAMTHPERHPKRAKLTGKLRAANAVKRSLPHMSNSAFEHVLKYFKENDVSQIAGIRMSFRSARDGSLEDTPYGQTLVTAQVFGTPPHSNREVYIINPIAYLHLVFRSGVGLFDAITRCHATNPSAVDKLWRLVLYSDEVTPGNNLSVQNNRKVLIIYRSLLELGYHLHDDDDDAWCPSIAEPSRDLKHVSSGIGQVFCQVIKLFFGGGDWPHDFRAGIKLDGPMGETIRLFAVLSMFLQDGGAHKLAWRCKGDGGTRPCMLCRNLVAPVSRVAEAAALLADDMIDGDLDLATNEDIKCAIARLKAFKLTESSTNFKLREQAIGFTLEDHNVLTDPSWDDITKPADQFCHDWMHGLFASGVFNIICFLVLLYKAQQLRGAPTCGLFRANTFRNGIGQIYLSSTQRATAFSAIPTSNRTKKMSISNAQFLKHCRCCQCFVSL